MSTPRVLLTCFGLTLLVIALGAPPAVADTDTLTGTWYGTFEVPGQPASTGNLIVEIFPLGDSVWAGFGTFPALGIYDQLVGVWVDGDTVSIGDPSPGGLLFEGTRDGVPVSGWS